MAKGTWDEKNKPKIPGFYNRMQIVAEESANNIQGVLAMPVKSDWGPVNKVVSVSQERHLKNAFGDNIEFTAYKLGNLALLGKPKELLLYRLVDNAAKPGELTLKNTESDGEIKLSTIYPSSKKFNITIRTNLINDEAKDIILYENTTQLVEVSALLGTIDEIVNKINKSALSDYIVASKVEGATGTLADIVNEAFSGGNDGTSNITNAEYLKAMKAFESYSIDGFVLDGVTDIGLHTSIKTWADKCKEEGLDVLAFVASNSESLSQANAKSKEYNDYLMHNVYLKSVTYDGVTYTAAEVAVYIAALAVGKNLKGSICNETTIFDSVEPRLTRTEIESALESGTIVLAVEDNEVIVVDDVNTYKNYKNEKEESLGNIRAIRFINTVNKQTAIAGKDYIGDNSNDETGHTVILCGLKTFFETYQKLNIISKFNIETDEELQKNAQSDEFFWKWDAEYINVIKKIFSTGNLK
ncbi:phage tail sheath family protein [uncultured Clostridium sp.]|uniref:phage tail sheath family protein n=1 Tax=uncultured Clostridium sp. TaxID=59620 RepID=UPI0028E5ABFA|nr:phage tail sheath family protein [uncultured Clostridium sp.]